MRKAVIRVSKDGFTYVALHASGGGGGFHPSNGMEHLTCFVGGMLVIASHFIAAADRADWWLDTGKEITRTCYEMYNRTASGIAPEMVQFDSGMHSRSAGFRLRPEALESIFYCYR